MEHAHVSDHHAVRLPLRLAAEPYAKQLSDGAVALDLHCSGAQDVELAMLVDDDGIRAFCSSRLLDRAELLSLVAGESTSSTEKPCDSVSKWRDESLWLLVRSSSGSNALQWHCYQGKDQVAAPVKTSPRAFSMTPAHDAFCARLITDSIRRYYAQQILEPSVRGFLSVLEKQFARADLYLFELLQNAVDDGADTVRFAVRDKTLQVSHNGRRFTPLDVLGLSSVGLSTKSRQGKRTIGFMGVGFKAVYKRYARVCIRDGTYSFVYQEPKPNKGGYGWVMLPMWTQQKDGVDSDTMCHFSLEQPRGGMQSILKDLSVLPVTAPPLLGRAALLKMEEAGAAGKKWTLDWNGKLHVVERTRIQQYTDNDTSEVVTVDITDRQGQTRQSKWLFVSHKFLPSESARATYLQHTKRSHSGMEEVCGFMDLTTRTTKAGRVHSVLPTKISLPIPMHVQGSWLLSVDRQEVQDLSDNAWNLDILKALPSVSANFFRWAASEKLEDYSALMPILPMPSPQNPDVTEMLGQSISLRGLQQALNTQRILPVAIPRDKDLMDTTDSNEDSSLDTGYYEGERSIWVPPSFLHWLSPDFLRNWLGKRPLRTDLMGDSAYHPIFASKHVIGQLCPLPERRSQLYNELLDGQRQPNIQYVQYVLRLMAAVGSAYDEHPDFSAASEQRDDKRSKNGKSINKNNTANTESPPATVSPALPMSMKEWPVFLTEKGSLATIDQVALPAEDFARVPADLAALLQPYLIKKEEPQRQISSQQSFGNGKKRGKKNGKQNKWQSMKSKPTLQRLHQPLEEAIIRADRMSASADDPMANRTIEEADASEMDQDQLSGHVASFLRRARSAMPSNAVGVPSAVSNLLDSISKQRGGSANDSLSAVMSITRFALKTENPSLLSYVLVDDPKGSGTNLVPTAQAYVGRSLDENGPGSDLENFAGKSLSYISSEYNSIIEDSPTNRKKLLKLFQLAGVHSGLSVSVSALVDVEQDRTTLQQIILPKLPDKKLPQLRKNATKCDISLPYGLGKVMNRKKYSFIDAELSHEWERLVSSMSTQCAVGFISLLLNVPVEQFVNASQKNVPAAAKCLSGQADPAVAKDTTGTSGNLLTTRIATDTAVPLRSRLFYLPPGQPGAKALDISEARIVKQLKALKWLPCAMDSSQSDSILTLLRPEEALLDPDVSRPEMPVVQLPDPLMKRLKSSLIAQSLTWGTQAPPPPVIELVELAQQAKCLDSSSFDGSRRAGQIYTEMVSVWTAIARAHLRGGLSASDMRTINSLARDPSNCYIPVRRVLEARDSDGWIVPIDRCVRMPEVINHANSGDELKQLAVASLVASNFMYDFNHATHNPFFSSPEISKAIIDLVGIPSLPDFQTAALIRASGSFVRYCYKTEPVISSRFSPIRDSFSYAMRWCIESPAEFGRINSGMKVWVRRQGTGSKALRPRWVSTKNGPVQAVLDDSRARSALLTPEMGIQVLGVLDHFGKEDCPNAVILSQIDKEVIQHCGIWRLSDRRFTVKTRARGAGVAIEGASAKLQLVCALLKSMEDDRSNEDFGQTSNGFLDPSYDPLDIIRHESLSREFKAPAMSSPVLTPMYAVFGRAPKSQKKCILVSGGPDDYSVELEDLILGHVGVLSGQSSQTKPYRAAIRLLSHLENDGSFTKFLNRDFADDFEVTQRWKQITERKRLLCSLQEAEKTKDTKSLRSLLMTAEEMCEDDPDGGDAVLRSARDLLAALEEEAKAQRVEERQNRLKQLKEAEIARDKNLLRSALILAEEACEDESDGGDSVLQSARDLLTLLEDEAKFNSLDNLSSSRRGRGVGRTLPSWMTSNDGPTPDPSLDVSESKSELVPMKASGKGRGINNLPAWMTTDPTTAATLNPVKLEADVADPSSVPSNLPPQMTSSDSPPVGDDPFGQSNHNSSHENVTEVHAETDLSAVTKPAIVGLSTLPASHPQVGVGRGRGVSNLPAWMTNKDEKPADSGPEVPAETDSNAHGPATAGLPSASASLPKVGSSRGRGASNLPAWMPNRQTELADSGPEAKADNNLPTVPASLPKAGVGRGRGVSNLPAWMMTNTDEKTLGSTLDLPSNLSSETLKRRHSRSSLDDTNDRPSKKTRDNLISSEYSLSLTIDSGRESGFIAWLEDKIEEGTKLHGGSATLRPSAMS